MPVVCTNVEQFIDGRWAPIGEKYRVVTVNGVSVGILGVTSSNQLLPSTIARHQDTLRLLPPLETAQQTADWLRSTGKAEVIVLLAEVENDALDQYASLLKGVDVIVGGYQTRMELAPTEIGGVIVNRAGSRGQLLASTQIIVSPEGDVVDWGGANVTLVDKMPESQELLERINAAKNESTLLMREVNRQEQQAARAQRDAERSQAGQTPPATEAAEAPSTEAAADQTGAATGSGSSAPQPAGRPE